MLNVLLEIGHCQAHAHYDHADRLDVEYPAMIAATRMLFESVDEEWLEGIALFTKINSILYGYEHNPVDTAKQARRTFQSW